MRGQAERGKRGSGEDGGGSNRRFCSSMVSSTVTHTAAPSNFTPVEMGDSGQRRSRLKRSQTASEQVCSLFILLFQWLGCETQ